MASTVDVEAPGYRGVCREKWKVWRLDSGQTATNLSADNSASPSNRYAASGPPFATL